MRVLNLRAVLNLNILTLDRGWRISLYERQHLFVQLASTDMAIAVQVHFLCGLENLKDALLCQSTAEDNGEVGEGG